MVLQSLLEKEPGYRRDFLARDEELDDSKDSCVEQVVFVELEKLRPAEKPKA